MPNFNHGRFLVQRIESVLNQTDQDFEVIILDDFSTDNSREIIEAFREAPKVRCIHYNSRNSGSPFIQWEKGIRLSKGEFIWIAESDDFASSEFLERVFAHFDNGADVVFCRSNIVDDKGYLSNDFFWPDNLDRQRWRRDYVNDGISEISDYLVYRNTIPSASACVFRKSKFRLPAEILDMRYCGDWLFWAHYLKEARIHFISTPLNFHRRHDGSTRGLKDFDSEVCRLKEYWHVIRRARLFCNKGRIKTSEFPKYNWIFEEMFQKRRVLGLRGMFAGLPLFLWPFFVSFYLKKSTYKLIKHVCSFG